MTETVALLLIVVTLVAFGVVNLVGVWLGKKILEGEEADREEPDGPAA